MKITKQQKENIRTLCLSKRKFIFNYEAIDAVAEITNSTHAYAEDFIEQNFPFIFNLELLNTINSKFKSLTNEQKEAVQNAMAPILNSIYIELATLEEIALILNFNSEDAQNIAYESLCCDENALFFKRSDWNTGDTRLDSILKVLDEVLPEQFQEIYFYE